MAMNLVDGRAGRTHINSDVLAVLNKGVFGEGDYVFDYGDNLSAVMTNANTVQIGTGALVAGGRRAINEAATNVTIQSGGQAQKRNDIVVARYNRTGEGDSIIESCDFAVVKGTPVSYGDATDPEIEQGDMPLWRIPIDGITPGEPEQMFEMLPSIDSLRDLVSQASSGLSKLNAVQTYGISGLSAVRVGRVVAVTLSLATSLPESFSSAVVATLPAGMRPGYFDMAAPCMTAHGAAACMVTVKTNGQVVLANQGGTPSGSNVKVAMVAFLTAG